MKLLVNIVARVLLAYFIALPILFGCHALLHQHSDGSGKDYSVEVIQMTDCLVCDLYHNQDAFITFSNYQSTTFIAGEVTLQGISNPSVSTPETLHIRGPPLV